MSEASDSKHMKTHVSRGLAWVGVASTLVAVLDIVALLVILNTWIDREELGIATKSVWIFPVLDQATDLGLSAAVIQRDDHDETKLSTVFWINLIVALVMFGMILVAAPFFAMDELVPPIRSAFTGVSYLGHAVVGTMLIVYGTKLLWQNVYFIPVALMKRELRFKELSVIRIIANIAEFAGKIGFAWAGWGIWCFVLGPMARVLVTGIGAQLRHPWWPKPVMKLGMAKEYVTFGLNQSGSQILFYFYTNIHLPIVGYFFGDKALGLYRLATEVVLEPVRLISAVIVDIAFPAFAKLRHNRDKLKAQLVSFTKLNLITVMSYSAVVFVAADDVVSVLFPDYPAADAIRILCAVAILRSVSLMIPPLLDGIGYPNRTFVYTLTASITLPIAFVIGAIVLKDLDYLSVAVAWGVGYPIAFAVLIVLAMYSLEWKTWAYFRSVAGVAGCMLGAGVVAYIAYLPLGSVAPWLRLVLISVVVVVSCGALLAYTQGMSIRTAMRAMKGDEEAA
jgi:polysaccharide transporter, PST family